MILQGAGIEFLRAIGDRYGEKSLRAPSPMRRLKLSKREYPPPRFTFRLKADASRSAVVAFIWMERTLLVPILHADVFQLAPRPTTRSLTPQENPARPLCAERKCSTTVTFEVSSAMRRVCGKDGGVLAVEPMENLDRHLDLHAFRHVEESAGTDARFVQRGEFRGAERRRLRHEMLPEKLFVLDHAALERLQDDPARAERFRERIVPQEMVVGENEMAATSSRRWSASRRSPRFVSSGAVGT